MLICGRIWNPPLRPIIHAMMFTSDLWQYMRTAGLRLSLQLLHIGYVGEDNILPLELVGIDMLADIFVSGGGISCANGTARPYEIDKNKKTLVKLPEFFCIVHCYCRRYCRYCR